MKNPARRLKDEQGFTLIELIVVILIIGILASIALPNFIGQRTRAFDANTKSDVRNLMTHVEACYTSSEDYRKCTDTSGLGTGMGIPLGTDKGQVEIQSGSADGYILIGRSKTGSTFTVTKSSGTWQITRTCTTASGGYGNSGCPSGTW